MWSLYLPGKGSEFTKGIADGEKACGELIEQRYDPYTIFQNPPFYELLRAEQLWRSPNLKAALKMAQTLYFEYLEKGNKTTYEKGFLEGIKLFINQYREDFYLQGFSAILPLELDNKLQLQAEEPLQELISKNETRPFKRKKAKIDWTEEDDKLIYSAVKKYTSGFASLPAGHTREDVLQESAQAWAKILMTKGGHDPAKGKKSTLLYRVVQNTIQDLIKAANTDKRKVNQNLAEFNDVYGLPSADLMIMS